MYLPLNFNCYRHLLGHIESDQIKKSEVTLNTAVCIKSRFLLMTFLYSDEVDRFFDTPIRMYQQCAGMTGHSERSPNQRQCNVQPHVHTHCTVQYTTDFKQSRCDRYGPVTARQCNLQPHVHTHCTVQYTILTSNKMLHAYTRDQTRKLYKSEDF